MITENIIIKQFDKNRWVINIPNGRNILVNEPIVQLVQILQRNSDLPTALLEFNSKFRAQLNEADFTTFIHQKLQHFGLLSEGDLKHSAFKYLKLRFEFLPRAWAKTTAYPFKFLFGANIFIPAFFVLIGLVSVIVATWLPHVSLLSVNYVTVALFIFVSALLHELGHIAACSAYGVNHGGVGFGFYFIFPVFYADISNVWITAKQNRIIINLAGIFNEFLFSATLCGLYLLFHKAECIVAAILIIFKALTEFNPFLRMDGYWILSDVTDTPNLLPRASNMVRSSFRHLAKNRSIRISLRNYRSALLFLYGITNAAVFAVYTVYMIANHYREIYGFPAKLVAVINQAISLDLNTSLLNRDFFLILFFYALISRIIIKKLIAITTNKLNGMGLFV